MLGERGAPGQNVGDPGQRVADVHSGTVDGDLPDGMVLGASPYLEYGDRALDVTGALDVAEHDHHVRDPGHLDRARLRPSWGGRTERCGRDERGDLTLAEH